MKEGWQTKTLGDVCIFDKAQGIHRGLPYVGLEHIESHTARFIGSFEPQPAQSSTFRFSEEHVLYGRLRPYLNKALAPDFDGHCSTEIFPLKPSAELSREYLLFWLLADETCDRINATCTGARMPRAQMNEVLGFEIPVPPLAEQQRIVGLLDEAFAGIATARANAEKNLRNAGALFESHLQSVFSRRGEGWVETTLGAHIDLLAGFAFKSANYTTHEKDIRLLRGDNIIQGCLRWDDVKRWPANNTKEYERYRLCEGDVVLAMDRPWVKAGLKHATISRDDLPCLLVQRTARLRGGANLDNRFLKLLIGSFAFTAHILGVQTGIGVPHISGQQIKDFEFARPPLVEQRLIADNLESLREETQRLARIYERKLAALEVLKKSLLHQAFTGAL
ncbi:MAG: restriction endonuclease subunit S [Rhodothermales bacterium]|nr:restriction endonuclease subunit S [Rhodothermales bacterium]